MNSQDRQTMEQVPDWPVLEIVVDAHGHGSINGKSVVAASEDAARNELLAEATRCAGVVGRPLRVKALDPRGVWHLIAHPDGAVTAVAEDSRTTETAMPSEPGGAPPTEDVPPFDTPDHLGDPGAEPRDADPGAGGLHLRVHPDGSITALDDLESESFPAPLPQRSPSVEPAPERGPEQSWSPPVHPVVDEPPPISPVTDRAVPDEREPEPAEPEPDQPAAGKPTVAWALQDEPGSTLLGDPGPDDDHFSLDRSGVDDAPTDSSSFDSSPFNRSPIDHSPFDHSPSDSDNQKDPPAETRRLSTPNPSPGGRQRDEPVSRSGAAAGSSEDDLVDDLRSGAGDHPDRTSSRRRWLRPAALVGAGAVTLAAILLISGTGGSSPPDASTAPLVVQRSGTTTAQPSGAAAADVAPSGRAAAAGAPPSPASPPARLTGGAPPGFSSAPIWGVPIAAASTALVSADGRVLVLTAGHEAAVVDPADGTVSWHVQAPDDATGLHLATIDGQRVAAVETPETLTYWSLPAARSVAGAAALASAVPSAAVTVRLAAGSKLSWAGPSPLVTMPDGTAAVIRGGEVQRVSLPTGLRPLAADGADVLAVQGRDWIRQRAGQAPGSTQRLSIPPKAGGSAPIRVENVGGSFLAGIWTSASGPVVAVYDAHSGAVAVQATFPRAANFAQATTIRQPGGDRTAIGPALLEPAQQNLSILSPDFTPVALAPGHVYANDVNRGVVDLQIKGPSFKIVPFAGKSPTIPIGITTVASQSRAIVVVPAGSGWLLCALPST
jgi:hypothetical protein